MALQFTVTFVTPVTYRAPLNGSAGGAVTYTAGSFVVQSFSVDPADGVATVHAITDAGDAVPPGSFAYNPTTQTISAALATFMAAKFPGNQATITYQ